MIDQTYFDYLVEVEGEDGEWITMVYHRSALGQIIAAHSPMSEDTHIKCTICLGGARVYVGNTE